MAGVLSAVGRVGGLAVSHILTSLSSVPGLLLIFPSWGLLALNRVHLKWGGRGPRVIPGWAGGSHVFLSYAVVPFRCIQRIVDTMGRNMQMFT